MKNIEERRFVIKKKPYQKIEDLELRKEKVSDEIYRTLLGLREVLPDIVWHQTARTKKKALERIVPIDPDHIRAIVDKNGITSFLMWDVFSFYGRGPMTVQD